MRVSGYANPVAGGFNISTSDALLVGILAIAAYGAVSAINIYRKESQALANLPADALANAATASINPFLATSTTLLKIPTVTAQVLTVPLEQAVNSLPEAWDAAWNSTLTTLKNSIPFGAFL